MTAPDLELGKLSDAECADIAERVRADTMQLPILDRLEMAIRAGAAARAVPREPTPEMMRAGLNVLRVTGGDVFDDVVSMWRAMYDAVPDRAAGEGKS